MVSERRIAANRANAQKSTGPKSAAGKARSRRNALKHGMTSAGDVLPLEDEVLFKERLAGWTNDARPVGDIERYLVASAVVASVVNDRAHARKEPTMRNALNTERIFRELALLADARPT